MGVVRWYWNGTGVCWDRGGSGVQSQGGRVSTRVVWLSGTVVRWYIAMVVQKQGSCGW